VNLDQLAGVTGIVVALVAVGCWLKTAHTARRLRRERNTARQQCADLGAAMLRHNGNKGETARRINEAIWISEMPADVVQLAERMVAEDRRARGWSS
jgi:hypothetical protein